MRNKIKLLCILSLCFICGPLSLVAKESTKSNKNDITTLSKKLEAFEFQQISVNSELKKSLDSIKTEIAALRKELESVKNQKCAANDCMEKINTQQKDISNSKEIEQIIIKYSNNPAGMATLHYAIKMGDVNAVSLLIANGADVNSITPSLRLKNIAPTEVSALSVAAIFDQFEVAKLLLENGADVNFVPYEKGLYPLRFAAEYSSGDLVSLLIACGAKLDRCCHLIEDSGYPIGAENVKSPLHIAAEKGNYEAVVALVTNGAQINGKFFWKGYIQNSKMETPLDLAAKSLTYADDEQNLELVKFLVNNGAVRTNVVYYENNNLKCPVISGYLKSVGK